MTGIRPVVVAIAGPIGSGKTTTARLLSRHTGWPATSYGDAVRAAAANSGLPGDRRELQIVGTGLIAGGWEPFTRQVLNQVGWMPGQAVIVEGVRHAEAAAALRQVTAPLPFFLLYLDLPARDGLVRASTREGTPSCPDVSHLVEQDLPAVRELAGLIVPVTGSTPGAVAGQILSYLREQQLGKRRG